MENEKQAIQVLEEFVRSVMAGGGFKKFEDLDKHREAIRVLKDADFARAAPESKNVS
jgi:hypothetical protein